MSCSHECRPDWKAYLLGELGPEDRRQHEECAAACPACREELATLRVTLDALSTLHEEEVPRRIAFVSDKVFEPRWTQRMWQSFLRPSFAAGAVIAVAILVHAFVRPPAAPLPQVDTAALETRITAEVNAKVNQRVEAQMAAAVNTAVDTAVTRAVAETRKQDDQRTAALLAAAERRYADTAEFLDRRVAQIYAMSTGVGVR
jgi:anti-sigma factor RsiW